MSQYRVFLSFSLLGNLLLLCFSPFLSLDPPFRSSVLYVSHEEKDLGAEPEIRREQKWGRECVSAVVRIAMGNLVVIWRGYSLVHCDIRMSWLWGCLKGRYGRDWVMVIWEER